MISVLADPLHRPNVKRDDGHHERRVVRAPVPTSSPRCRGGLRRIHYYLLLREVWPEDDLDDEGLPRPASIHYRSGHTGSNLSQIFGAKRPRTQTPGTRGPAAKKTEQDPLIAYATEMQTSYPADLQAIPRLIIEAQEWSVEPFLLGWRTECHRLGLDSYESAIALMRTLARWKLNYPGLAPLDTVRNRYLPDAVVAALRSVQPRDAQHPGVFLAYSSLAKRVITSGEAGVDVSVAGIRGRLAQFDYEPRSGSEAENDVLAALGRLVQTIQSFPDGPTPLIRQTVQAAFALLQEDTQDHGNE